MDRLLLMQELIRDERKERFVYQDSKGIPTIGVGRNLRDRGLSDAEIEFLLNNDITDVERDLDRMLPWWRGLSENRQRVLANMTFNMGIARLLGFGKMLGALKTGAWLQAAAEMKDSAWAAQVGIRATRLINLMKMGLVLLAIMTSACSTQKEVTKSMTASIELDAGVEQTKTEDVTETVEIKKLVEAVTENTVITIDTEAVPPTPTRPARPARHVKITKEKKSGPVETSVSQKRDDHVDEHLKEWEALKGAQQAKSDEKKDTDIGPGWKGYIVLGGVLLVVILVGCLYFKFCWRKP